MDPISVETIAAAERLAGVRYTAAERAQMLGDIEAQVAAAVRRRSVSLPNAAPPALRFDPRLPGFPAPAAQMPLRFTQADPGPLPADPADIAFAPATRLSEWIRRGALASRALTEIYLDRIAAQGPSLEAWACVAPGTARAQADAADALLRRGRWLGPLHGLPYGLKDLFDTAGLPTEWGAEPYRGRVPDRDARIVEMLRDAGAVLLGKTAVGALAYGDIWDRGRCRNPWNPEEGSSGSSAGSAAAVAAAQCAFAIGTETLGSITSPAQRCGCTGLRPTFGRVSRRGAMALCWSLDKVGPLARTVEDCAMALGAIDGPDPADPGAIDAPYNFDARAPLGALRVGWLPEAFDDAGATEVDRAALAAAGRIATLVPVALPDLPWDSLVNILFAEAAAAFEELTLSDRDDALRWQADAAWPNAFRKARFLSAVDHVQLDRLRFRAMQALDALFRDVDLLIGPFSTGPMLVASNFTGHPCLHLRAGFRKVGTRRDEGAPPPADAPLHEVPHGISLWGRLFDEGRLCAFGMALEAELGVAGRRPPLYA